MADKVQVKFRGGRIQVPKLDESHLTAMGTEMVLEQKRRWAKSINADGAPAKPLQKHYMFVKKKITRISRPKRDNKLRGILVENFQLRKAINDKIRAENSTRKGREHARGAQMIEEMIGYAPSDQKVAVALANDRYGRYVQSAWIPGPEVTV